MMEYDGFDSGRYGMNHMRVEYFGCECQDFQHSFRIMFDPTETDIRFLDMYLEASFPPMGGFWARLWTAAKYVWKGRTEPYQGCYITDPDLRKLRNLFTEYDMCIWKLREAQKKKDKATKGDKIGDQQKDNVPKL